MSCKNVRLPLADRFMERILSQVTTQDSGRTVRVETPKSLSGLLATSAPHLLIQL